MTTPKKNIGAIILAAGGSSRLGTPKQLLPFAGKTLLQYAVEAAGNSVASPVIAVLGSEAELVRKEIEVKIARIIVNTEWREGIASSIRCGINALMQADPSAEGVVILVCDQPYITSALLDTLVKEHWETGKPIVASSYDNTIGVPALFHKSIFPALLQLSGDAGAKSILRQRGEELGTVAFSKGGIDIDSEGAYKGLSKNGLQS